MVVKRPNVVNATTGATRAAEGRWIYGVNAVRRRIEKRPESIKEVGVAKRSGPRVHDLLTLLPARLPVREMDDAALSRLAGTAAHQGIVARTDPFQYGELDAVLSRDPTLLLVVDRMQDPQNFGALLRTAAASGVAAVVIPRDGAVGVTAAVEKAAAGGVNDVPVCQVVNVRRTLDALAEQGFWRIGLVARGGDSLYGIDLPSRLVVVLGGEGGMRPLVAQACDFRVSIPMAVEGIESLNASVAAAVTLFEVMRRRLLDR